MNNKKPTDLIVNATAASCPAWAKRIFEPTSKDYFGLCFTQHNYEITRAYAAKKLREWRASGHNQNRLYHYGRGRKLWKNNQRARIHFGLDARAELAARRQQAAATAKANTVEAAAKAAYKLLPLSLQKQCTFRDTRTCDDPEDGGCGGCGKVETSYNPRAGLYGRSYYGPCPRCNGRGTWEVVLVDKKARALMCALWASTKNNESETLRVFSQVYTLDSGETLEEERNRIADELNMPEDSQTVALALGGLISMAEAHRRAAKIVHRHENTNYDALLRAGYDRDEARECMEEVA